jgi:quercetin dioxygenase-like cupin family protein
MIEYPEEGVLSKELVKTENLNVDLFCMAAGKEISEHTSSKEGSILVLEGDGIFNLEGKDIKMEKGVFIHMGANAKHSLKANENTSFILTLIKGDLI